MRTTVRLSDALLSAAEREANRRGQTLSALIEQGLRLVLPEGRSPRKPARILLPECHASSGTLSGINLSDNSSLLDVIEDGP